MSSPCLRRFHAHPLLRLLSCGCLFVALISSLTLVASSSASSFDATKRTLPTSTSTSTSQGLSPLTHTVNRVDVGDRNGEGDAEGDAEGDRDTGEERWKEGGFYALVMFVVSLVSCLVPLFLRRSPLVYRCVSVSLRQRASAVAGGMMFAAGLFLSLEAVHLFVVGAYTLVQARSLGIASVLGGFIGSYVLEAYSIDPSRLHPSERTRSGDRLLFADMHGSGSNMSGRNGFGRNGSQYHESVRQSSSMRTDHVLGSVLATLLSMHSISSGFAIGLQSSLTSLSTTFLSAIIRKGPEGFALGLHLARSEGTTHVPQRSSNRSYLISEETSRQSAERSHVSLTSRSRSRTGAFASHDSGSLSDKSDGHEVLGDVEDFRGEDSESDSLGGDDSEPASHNKVFSLYHLDACEDIPSRHSVGSNRLGYSSSESGSSSPRAWDNDSFEVRQSYPRRLLRSCLTCCLWKNVWIPSFLFSISFPLGLFLGMGAYQILNVSIGQASIFAGVCFGFAVGSFHYVSMWEVFFEEIVSSQISQIERWIRFVCFSFGVVVMLFLHDL